MKCPLLWASVLNSPRQVETKHGDCLKEECAWWDEERVCCHFRTLSKQVDRLADRINEIRDKMPHEEQFRK